METVSHNFGRVSARDEQAFASSRAGFPSKSVAVGDVPVWIDFMHSNGIKRVLSLLGDDEASEYYPGFDIDDQMRSAFGLDKYTRTSVFSENAYDVMSKALADASASGETIVMHCSGGEGRAAIAMGLWLVNVYDLAPEDATREIDEQAKRTEGIVRRTSAAKLTYLIKTGSMKGFS